MAVKIVFFDALHTIVQPRIPIFEQVSLIIISVVFATSRSVPWALIPAFGVQLTRVVYNTIFGCIQVPAIIDRRTGNRRVD